MPKHPPRTIALTTLSALALLITACQALPIKVALQDITINLGAITNTQGTVLYPATPSAFQKANLHVATATIDGGASATGLNSDTTFTFYGRATDPSTDPNCTQVTNLTHTYYACPANQETSISNPTTLPANGNTTPIHLSGNVLATAANQGKLWLGATVQGTTSTNATLHFTHLTASITLL